MFVNLFILPLQFFKKKSASFLVLNLPLMVLWYQSFLKRTLQSLEPSLSKSLPLKMAVFVLITDDVLSLEKWTMIQELIVSQEFAWHKQDEMLSSLSIFILILLYFIKKTSNCQLLRSFEYVSFFVLKFGKTRLVLRMHKITKQNTH